MESDLTTKLIHDPNRTQEPESFQVNSIKVDNNFDSTLFNKSMILFWVFEYEILLTVSFVWKLLYIFKLYFKTLRWWCHIKQLWDNILEIQFKRKKVTYVYIFIYISIKKNESLLEQLICNAEWRLTVSKVQIIEKL